MIKRAFAGFAGAWTALAGSGVAGAEPAPPPDPAVIAPSAEAAAPPLDPFAAASEQTKSDQVGTLAGLLAGPSGASPVDVLNQGVGLTAPPPFDPLASVGILYPQYYRMPTGEETSPYVLQTDVPPSPFARVDAFRGVHALIHGGLGRMPRDELSAPLPGTAPPQGTNIPPGLEQFYVAVEPPPLLPPPAPPEG